MPILLKSKSYNWLKQIGIFRNEPFKTQSPQIYEIPYDEEIYLQNGYLIGLILRKFVKIYSTQYQQLLKIRKIAIFKSSQNWQIIQPFLQKIGCDVIMRSSQLQDGQVQISAQQIGQILEILYEQYGPEQDKQVKISKRIRYNYVDIYRFSANKLLDQAQNSLQLMCILLVKNLQVTLGEALGLLINKAYNLKNLIRHGSLKDDYEKIKFLYEHVTQSWPIINQFLLANPKDTQKILQGLSQGVLSQNNDIIHLTLNLLSYVTDQEWFIKIGYFKLLFSTHIQCFYFTIERIAPNYQKILNQNLHFAITNKLQLFTILYNLLKILPKTIYAKEILTHLSITYFYQQCYKILNVQEIDDQPANIVIKAMEVLSKLIIYYPNQIPNGYLKNVYESFQFNCNRSYQTNYFVLALLFDILEGLMIKQSQHIQNLFKIAMKYLKQTFGETKHWIIENLKYLYKKMGKFFPLGCMLQMYSLDIIGQADQYQLFYLICQDNSLTSQQCTMTLNYITKYIESQFHCKCFLLLLRKFLAYHPSASSHWASQLCLTLLPKMQQMNIPIFTQGQINILNPKPPKKNRAINSIGLKRKQMMKLGDYELSKNVLQILTDIKDKKFLNYYIGILWHTIQGIEKQISHKKKQLVNLLKTLIKKTKMKLQQLPQIQPMNQIVKTIMQNRSSSMSRSPGQSVTFKHLNNITPQLVQSKFFDSYSRILTQPANKQKIDQQQDENNQFVTEDNQNQVNINVQKSKQKNDKNFSRKQNLLLQFTNQSDEQKLQWDGILIENNLLQQNQIAYMNVMKQKHSKMLKFCHQLYRNCQASLKNLSKTMQNFLIQTDLKNIIKNDMAQQIILKLKTRFAGAQLIQNFLIQTSFRAFSFKQNRRVAVTCISSLFALLHQNLCQKYPQYASDNEKRSKDLKSLNKTVKYQNIISNKLKEGNSKNKIFSDKFQSYSLCFEILSQLCFQKLKLSLVQPLSKQINQMMSNNTVQKNFQANIEIYPHPQQPNQILPWFQNQQQYQRLEKQLSMLQAEQQVQNSNFRVKKQMKYNKDLYKKQKMKTKGNSLPTTLIQSNKEEIQKNTIDINPIKQQVNHKQLRNKIAQRLQILQKDLTKTIKNQLNQAKQVQ